MSYFSSVRSNHSLVLLSYTPSSQYLCTIYAGVLFVRVPTQLFLLPDSHHRASFGALVGRFVILLSCALCRLVLCRVPAALTLVVWPM